MGYRLYAVIALAILLGAPLVVHLASSIGPHRAPDMAEAPRDAPPAAAPAESHDAPMPEAPPPPQEPPQPIDPGAVADAAPSLDPHGSTPGTIAVQPSTDQPALPDPAPQAPPPPPSETSPLQRY